MNRSTFCEIKYTNRLFFSKAGYMTGDGFKILTRTLIPKLPRSPPHNHRGYERVYKFKDQYMNMITFCEIKYMNRLFFFSKAGYMIGVGFKILTCRPVPKLSRVPSHIREDMEGYINSKNSI